VIQEGHLVGHRHDMAVLQRDEPARADTDVLAGRGGPHELTGQRPGLHVQDASVAMDARRRQEQRLVIDVEFEDRRVRHADDRLAPAGKRMRLLGMHDRPRLVEAVDEHAGRGRRASLLEAAADAKKAVGEREDRLGAVDILIRVPCLHQAPRLGRIEVLRKQDDLTLQHDPNGKPLPESDPTVVDASPGLGNTKLGWSDEAGGGRVPDRVEVGCYAGGRGEETPRVVLLGGREVRLRVERRWIEEPVGSTGGQRRRMFQVRLEAAAGSDFRAPQVTG
jgi:hypothetical protein